MNISSLETENSHPFLIVQLEQLLVAAIPMKHAQEVVVVQARRITPIPNMPECVIGLLNQRSKVFWVVDIAFMLGFEPLNRDAANYNIAIIRVNNNPLALAIREVKGVIRLTEESILSPMGTVTPNLVPYLKGCVLQEKGVLLILSAEAIVNSAMLQSYY